jgi:plasmid stabilization system protein ParE
MNVIVRPQLYQDIEEEVYWLLENASADVARGWHDALWRTIELLKTHPEMGRVRKDLKQPGIRSWRVQHFTRWLIFYGLRAQHLILYRVRSSMMNLLVLKMES